MRIGIDASNLKDGGGVTHLVEILAAADPEKFGVTGVTVWGGDRTLALIEERPWLTKVHPPSLNRGLVRQSIWRYRSLDAAVKSAGCDILFAPGGSYSGAIRPIVTMSRNLLPFEPAEVAQFGVSLAALRLRILKGLQMRTFARADAVIFLTDLARRQICESVRVRRAEIVPHGVSTRFGSGPRPQRDLSEFSESRPFRLLYVSTVTHYKRQDVIAGVVARLRSEGLPVSIDFVGRAYPPALARLMSVIRQHDPSGQFMRYRGQVPYGELSDAYQAADMFVLASVCETFGQVILEAMASGLPLACSDRSAMPEVAGNAAAYFNPDDPTSVHGVLKSVISSTEERRRMTEAGVARSRTFSWTRCADDTLRVLTDVANKARQT